MERIKGNKFICECCGGSIDPSTYKCEYCGTQYKRDPIEQVLRIETYRSPIRTFSSRISLDNNDLRYLGANVVSELALKDLASQLSECIAPYMHIEHNFDISHMEHEIKAQIKIVEPCSAADTLRVSLSNWER